MEELNCNFFSNPSWDINNNNNSVDQNDPFESALSSMVSSPTASNTFNNGEHSNNIVLRELIGRLGSICNSGELSPFPNNTASCYSTPLNSPPKLNLENHQGQQIRAQNPYPSFPFAADPGFAERAARFSCFAQMGLGEIGAKLDSSNISRVSSNQSIKEKMEVTEISSISEQIQIDANSRKRKAVPKGKGKENPASAPAKDANVVAGSESNESNAKRSKSENDDGGKKEKDNGDAKSKDSSKNAAEAPKDYIHVRARRGQATDAHSLAERVRREKISERMKLLQDLVPGCNKVTGKAVMLDEIINYVQSLQRQVEFLSMKLATVNPRMDFNVESLVSKDAFQSRGVPQNMYPSDCYPFQSQPNLHTAIPNGPEALHHFNASLGRNQLPPMNGFESASQVSSFWENDLNNVVQMGYGQNLTRDVNGAQMKVEP